MTRARQEARLRSQSFDYVIVGAGTAGCLLASRLSEDAASTVCLLEAGPPDRHPYLHIPAGFIRVLNNPRYTWSFQSEPIDTLGGRRIPATQGKTLGGSSAINGMIYNRCQAGDYDKWAQLGNRGWSYADVLPYFRRSERRIGGDDRFRGRDGMLAVSDSEWRHPICDAFVAAAQSAGIPHNTDYNGSEQAGVGPMQRTISGRWRWSSATAFLKPAMRRSNLAVLTDATAEALLFDGRRAAGVRYRRNGSSDAITIRARREVIVCAGAINSPRLLQVSGVGPAALVKSLGVEVVHDLPGVGENLRDHFCARLVVRAKNTATINELSRGLRLVQEALRWGLGRPSILSLSPSVMHLFWKSDEALDLPDLQGVFAPASYHAGIVGVLDEFPGMTLGFYQQRPRSVGTVRARSVDTSDPPAVQPNYLAIPDDRNAIVAGLRLGRKVLGQPPLSRFVDGEELPGPDVADDAGLLDYARDFGSTVYHFAGTCRMGPDHDAMAVLDDRLRVRGVEALRVVDASVMPNMPSGNTAAPVMMIAEKASDMIRGRHPLIGRPER